MSFKSSSDNGAYRHPSPWADPAPGPQALVRAAEECEREVHVSLWEEELAEESRLVTLFWDGAP